MLEGAFTRKLIAALKHHPALRDCYITKHADRFNAGIPDFSVSRGRVTVWYECKIWPNKPTKLQAWTLKKLGDGGALITVQRTSASGQQALFCSPLERLVGAMGFEQLVEEIVTRSLGGVDV